MLTSTLQTKRHVTKGISRRKLLWLVLLIAFLYIGYQLATRFNLRNEGVGLQKVSPPVSLSAFHLQDHTGRVFDLPRLQGQWSILFFGFTQCPDICPATLQQLALLDAELMKTVTGKAVPQMVFVSVDPERDSQHLAEYVGYFAGHFIGVTGGIDEIGKLEQGVGAWHQYPSSKSGSYNVAHSGELFLINPNGELHAKLQPPLEIQRVSQQLQMLMRENDG